GLMKLPESLLPPQLGSDYPGMMIGVRHVAGEGEAWEPRSPVDGQPTASFRLATPVQVGQTVEAAAAAFRKWCVVPAPHRGELVRRIGELAREHKQSLAEIITAETGKIRPEAEGEVQEWIDVCDFAVGLSRQLHGHTIASERPAHTLIEHWHPLGPVGVISAFNFPCAVWAWNAMIGLVCGDPIVWKPSEQTPLTALACQQLVSLAVSQCGSDVPHGI